MGRIASILKQGDFILDRYEIRFFLKKGSYAETYRVKDQEGNVRFLKLFVYAQLDRTQFNSEGGALEIDVLKLLEHKNLVKYHDSGEFVQDGQKYGFVVLDFISGETLADKMKREKTLNQYEAKEVVLAVLEALSYLHNLDRPILHNDITNLNVMLDMTEDKSVPKLIDFGFARYLDLSNSNFQKEGLNPFYLANEAFNKVFSVQSDIYAVGCLYYHLLFGLPPWFIELSQFKSDRISMEDALISERRKPLSFPNMNTHIDQLTYDIITKALAQSPAQRFKNAEDFIKAVDGEFEFQLSNNPDEEIALDPVKPKEGGGFSAIAGMRGLKDMIKHDVIDALNDKEKYAEYGLTIPNGMLLFGPPGCGKTFFAEKMAEEIGFSFYQINPSDIQSKWVNASQENIKKLFDEAKAKAPSVVFIDELDALVPNRDTSGINHMNTSAVNEFLAQMNNIGEEGVFIIGATNRPKAIDPAILRAGRLDKHIYIPPPDFEAREQMFELYLKNRPTEIGMSYSKLAELTENFVSSDIKLLCDESARAALKNDSRITFEIIENTIKSRRSSLTSDDLNKYLDMKKEMEGNSKGTENDRPSIGFNRN